MAMLGRLVDGIAHEILDPVGFIWGNLTHVSRYSQEILEFISAYEHHVPEPATQPQATCRMSWRLIIFRKIFLVPSTASPLGPNGCGIWPRVYKTFCHVDDVYPKPADIQ